METCNTVTPALKMAVKNRQPESNYIFHSARGVQHCAKSFLDIMRNLCPGVRQSMSRKGNCWDNACAESFFKTLKSEEVKLNGKYFANDVRQAVFFLSKVFITANGFIQRRDYIAPNDYYSKKVA